MLHDDGELSADLSRKIDKFYTEFPEQKPPQWNPVFGDPPVSTGLSQRSLNDPSASILPETATNWPEPLNDEAFYGLAGEIVKAIEPRTEADQAAILLQVLVSFGLLVGRGPHVRVEGDQHHANLFAILVGNTSKARKGTAWGRVCEIFSCVDGWPGWKTGLASGEGLKWHVRDATSKYSRDEKTGDAVEIEIDPGISDKRLLVIEPEFSQVLRQGARAGNTLSATIRSAWDGTRLGGLTKNDPITATDAHISIIGHITADELKAELTATDTANGFANRFLFMCVKRSKKLAFGGGAIPENELADFAKRLAMAAGNARRLEAVPMTQEAHDLWKRVYPILSEGQPGLFGAATARAEAQCLRLALIYALMNNAQEIAAPHLEAAIALWDRAETSVKHIFGSALGDGVADEILRALRASGANGLSRTDVSNLFKRHEKAERIGAALELLARKSLAYSEKQGTDGRAVEVWKAR